MDTIITQDIYSASVDQDIYTCTFSKVVQLAPVLSYGYGNEQDEYGFYSEDLIYEG